VRRHHTNVKQYIGICARIHSSYAASALCLRPGGSAFQEIRRSAADITGIRQSVLPSANPAGGWPEIERVQFLPRLIEPLDDGAAVEI
jgi:hypothetical protein